MMPKDGERKKKLESSKGTVIFIYFIFDNKTKTVKEKKERASAKKSELRQPFSVSSHICLFEFFCCVIVLKCYFFPSPATGVKMFLQSILLCKGCRDVLNCVQLHKVTDRCKCSMSGNYSGMGGGH